MRASCTPATGSSNCRLRDIEFSSCMRVRSTRLPASGQPPAALSTVRCRRRVLAAHRDQEGQNPRTMTTPRRSVSSLGQSFRSASPDNPATHGFTATPTSPAPFTTQLVPLKLDDLAPRAGRVSNGDGCGIPDRAGFSVGTPQRYSSSTEEVTTSITLPVVFVSIRTLRKPSKGLSSPFRIEFGDA